MERLLEGISVHNKVEHLQMNLTKVVIDLIYAVHLFMSQALPLGVSVSRLTIASVDANCTSKSMTQTNVKSSIG
ncbi:hypothetical protein PHMEG_0008616 [Phytophthora megakarya]|uniref:Uncharacterized protein n=1 Tax=Phytophthora megakarya TaxID=4795 RepID=A0A225WI96_9STRA|nr:hypothetical protein PHMEG_0008616 [Phytophthora megakarya]